MSLPAPTRHCVQCACRLAERSANVVLARSKADPSRCEDCAAHPALARFDDESGDRLVGGAPAAIRISPGGPVVEPREPCGEGGCIRERGHADSAEVSERAHLVPWRSRVEVGPRR